MSTIKAFTGIFVSITLFSVSICLGQFIAVKKTVTYQLITNDAELLGNNKEEIKECVALLKKASARIKKNFPKWDFKKADKETAIRVLRTIDSVFTEFGFLFYTDSKDIHYDFLTLAFRDVYNADNHLFINRNRAEYFRSFGKQQCKLIDCDLYCFIYLGIAEMNNLPLSMIELPRHNFIRWNFNDGLYINWEAIEGTYHPEDETLSCYGRLNDINRKYFLRPWATSEVFGYYYTLRGSTFGYNNQYLNPQKAKRDYETALTYSSRRSGTFNNLAWIHVVNPTFDNDFDLSKLLDMTDTAIRLVNDRNYYDTKAGVYAQAGDFKNAILTLEQGIKVDNDPDDVLAACQKHLGWFNKGLTIREGKNTEK